MSGGFLEHRTRITIFLPHYQRANAKAFASVLRYLESQRKSRSSRTRVTGYTSSNRMLQVYRGVWWGKEPRDPPDAADRWVGEFVAHLIVDYEGAHDEIQRAIGRLRKQILAIYEKYQSAQTDVWITAESVVRYVEDDELTIGRTKS